VEGRRRGAEKMLSFCVLFYSRLFLIEINV
jgi:hypothetical protein